MTPIPLRSTAAPGFTLLELLVTVAVLAILVAVAVPAQSRVVASSQVTAAANDLFGALQFARQESVRRNAAVQVCGSTQGLSCDGAGWQQWIVRSGSGEILRSGTMAPSVSVHAAGLFVAGMQFSADGRFHQAGSRAQEGTMLLCSPRGKRRLELEARGGVQLRLLAGTAGGCP